MVLQVDPPADHKDYLHRSGRTARAGGPGTVVTLALPHQRRGMERLARDAGIDAVPSKAAPGDAVLPATGAPHPERRAGPGGARCAACSRASSAATVGRSTGARWPWRPAAAPASRGPRSFRGPRS